MKLRLNGNDFHEMTAGFHSLDSVHTHPHNGIDLAMQCGSHLNSPTNGIVEHVVDYGSQNIGKGIIIKTDDGEHLILGHLSDNSHVYEGQHIQMGDYIADTGTTGHSTGCHLHVGLRDSHNNFISPDKYFNDSNEHIASLQSSFEQVDVGEHVSNVIHEYADFLGSLGMNLISSINWDFIFDTLDFICSVFIL